MSHLGHKFQSDRLEAGVVLRADLEADIIDGTLIEDDAVDSEHLVDGSIDTAHLSADCVDGTKIADDAVDSEHIVDGSIDTAHLSADCVDGTKIADDSIDSEHYVDGSIDTAHLSADCVDGTKIADDSIDSEHYVDGSIDTAHLSADCVDGTKIADDSIDSEHYVDGSIDTAHLAADCVDGTKIADDAIDSEHYAADSIDSEHYAAGSVDTTALGADAVDGTKIADDAVDSEHIADGAVDGVHLSDIGSSRAIGGRDEGHPAVGYVYADGVVADAETVVLDGRTYEFDVINTDSGEDTAGGAWNNTTDPLASVTFSTHGRAAGDLIRVENEIMRVTTVHDVDTLTLARGVSGTTAAAHADANDIYTSAAGPGFSGDVAVGLVADLSADQAMTALAADINGDASGSFYAGTWTGNDDTSSGITLIERTIGGSDLTIAETGTNVEKSAATTQNAAAVAVSSMWTVNYTFTAQDATTMALGGGDEVVVGGVNSSTEPVIIGATLRTSADAFRPFLATMNIRAVQINSGYWAVVFEDSNGDVANGDVLTALLVV